MGGWLDYDGPASYHGGAGGFSFADGHSEKKKWTSPRILQAPLKGVVRPYPTPLGGGLDRDVVWMQERATHPPDIIQAHQQGLKLWIYTINDIPEATGLLDWGVDGIITANPSLIWRAMALRGSQEKTSR